MTKEQVMLLQDAWYILRDVQEEVKDPRVFRVLGELHEIIDAEYEKEEAK